MAAGSDTQGYATMQGDSRITPIGRFIRKTSIDELPQLFNVLKGDMSLVGPRPDTPMQQSLYTPEDWQTRHTVRPGITGLAQVNGRSMIGYEERLACDLDYARNHTLWMDMVIILKTLRVLTGKGSN
jgi:lipopolysaccharide/colanic/teichoic acid biosynthesis glycosyltransferase